MTIQDEGSVVGTAGSISTLNFVGAGILLFLLEVMVQQSLSSGGVTNADVVAQRLLWDDYKYLNGDNAPF